MTMIIHIIRIYYMRILQFNNVSTILDGLVFISPVPGINVSNAIESLV